LPSHLGQLLSNQVTIDTDILQAETGWALSGKTGRSLKKLLAGDMGISDKAVGTKWP
jgi:hypothetical protein